MKKKLKKKYLVEKRNTLNEMRSNNITLQELRFFSIYLSKINARDINTRVVRFSLDDFRAIMELGRLNIAQLKSTASTLLAQIMAVQNTHNDGFTAFQIFKKFKVDKDENNEWYVEIDAHDDALPLMFEFKDKYFTYELWNALRLRSKNQLRMYEILKQYEKTGYRILKVEDLKGLLGIETDEYPKFHDFKRYVLDVCQEALAKYTDIRFTYEPHGKKGLSGKVLQLKFTITKNKEFVDPLNLGAFIDLQKDADVTEPENINSSERLELLMKACNNIFSFDEISIISDLLDEKVPYMTDTEAYKYLSRKYKEMIMNDKSNNKVGIKNKFRYLKKIITVDIEKLLETKLLEAKKDKFAKIYVT